MEFVVTAQISARAYTCLHARQEPQQESFCGAQRRATARETVVPTPVQKPRTPRLGSPIRARVGQGQQNVLGSRWTHTDSKRLQGILLARVLHAFTLDLCVY